MEHLGLVKRLRGEVAQRPQRPAPSSQSFRSSPSHTFLEPFDARPEALDNVPDMANLVEFALELVHLPQYLVEASDLGVGDGHGVVRRRRLRLGRELRLLVQLWIHACARTCPTLRARARTGGGAVRTGRLALECSCLGQRPGSYSLASPGIGPLRGWLSVGPLSHLHMTR